MNDPIYLISGIERRKEKHHLAKLKFYVRMFWFYEDIDRIYGGGMDDEQCNVHINTINEEINILENNLKLKL